MHIKLIIAALMVSAAVVSATERVTDLTGAKARTFKAHLGQVVSLEGRLTEGVPGLCLSGATPEDVGVYIIAEVPERGSFVWPAQWYRLRDHRVRVTSRLKFRAFPPNHDPARQTPPNYYYMVLQNTELRRLDSK